MIIAGAGHRPNKLGGYDFYKEKGLARLTDLAVAAIKVYNPDKIISGMALGWDTGLALGAIRASVPLIAAVPFEGQELRWTPEQQKTYRSILEKAQEVVVINKHPYTPLSMHDRNAFMVDWCDLVLALWNGSQGGTYDILQYAQTKKRQIINLWSSWMKYKDL